MEILLNIVLLVVGFGLLIKGADLFVDGSSALAQKFKVPGVVIGLTIVAMGTSAPELAVSVSAALSGSNAIAVSNVVGSNIFNLLGVLGVCALISPMAAEKGIMKKDYPLSLIVTAILAIFVGSKLLFGGQSIPSDFTQSVGALERWMGIILLIIFISYIVYTVINALKNRAEGEEIVSMPVWKSLIFIVIGIAAIVLGGQLVVENAKEIAYFFGMSETLVGLTIVAIGTSLPELVTSVVASKKGQNGMAVGNVVGSNLFNILFILGTSVTINPITVSMESLIDICIVLVISIICYIMFRTSNKVTRGEGAAMVIMYIAYTAYAIIR